MTQKLTSLPKQVPQTLYPDSYNAMNSSIIDRLITTKLREDALVLRAKSTKSLSYSSLSSLKDEMLREIHLILTITLGPPPKPSKDFTWEFYDSNGKFHSIKTSPLKFSQELSSSTGIRSLGGTDIHKLFS